MRTLAIDSGSRRVGLAMSDAGGRLATPFAVLQVRSLDAATDAILRVIRVEGVERLVVGVPLNMDGSMGPAARSAAQWGRRLGASAGVPVVFVDERLSSFDADVLLRQRRESGEKLTRARRRRQQDALAAAGLLQALLDGRIAPLSME